MIIVRNTFVLGALGAALAGLLPVAFARAAAGEGTQPRGPARIDRDLERYWGPTREAVAVERRLFSKKGRFGVELLGGTIPNDPMKLYWVAGGRVTYHPWESLGFGLTYARPMASESELERKLVERARQSVADAGDTLEHMAQLELQFAPLYGKFNAFGRKLTHFDLVFRLAAGWMGTSYLDIPDDRRQEPTEKTHNALLLGGGLGFRFFVTDHLAASVEFTQYMFGRNPSFDDREAFSDRQDFPALVALGVGGVFPGGSRP